jgi:hypothetical protein
VQALPNVCADLIILDLMLPKLGGMDLPCDPRNSRHKDTPFHIFPTPIFLKWGESTKAGGNKVRSDPNARPPNSYPPRELVGSEAGQARANQRKCLNGAVDCHLAEQLEGFPQEGPNSP